jgi:transcription termination factor Rho
VIYEKFKGTGNMEIHLDRRMYSASSRRSTSTAGHAARGTAGSRRKCCPRWVLRKLLYPMDDLEAAEFLVTIRSTKNNADFFDSMRRG